MGPLEADRQAALSSRLRARRAIRAWSEAADAAPFVSVVIDAANTQDFRRAAVQGIAADSPE
jgi:hypothetical protein